MHIFSSHLSNYKPFLACKQTILSFINANKIAFHLSLLKYFSHVWKYVIAQDLTWNSILLRFQIVYSFNPFKKYLLICVFSNTFTDLKPQYIIIYTVSRKYPYTRDISFPHTQFVFVIYFNLYEKYYVKKLRKALMSYDIKCVFNRKKTSSIESLSDCKWSPQYLFPARELTRIPLLVINIYFKWFLSPMEELWVLDHRSA